MGKRAARRRTKTPEPEAKETAEPYTPDASEGAEARADAAGATANRAEEHRESAVEAVVASGGTPLAALAEAARDAVSGAQPAATALHPVA